MRTYKRIRFFFDSSFPFGNRHIVHLLSAHLTVIRESKNQTQYNSIFFFNNNSAVFYFVIIIILFFSVFLFFVPCRFVVRSHVFERTGKKCTLTSSKKLMICTLRTQHSIIHNERAERGNK